MHHFFRSEEVYNFVDMQRWNEVIKKMLKSLTRHVKTGLHQIVIWFEKLGKNQLLFITFSML